MRKTFAAILLVLASGIAAAADGTGRPNIVFSSGIYAPFHHGRAETTAGIFDVSYRWSQQYWGMSPLVGAFVTSAGDAMIFAGSYHDFRLGARWILTPYLSMGAYRHGDNDLGGVFEFYWGLELAYRMDNDWRVGLSARHISNAGINRHNPGTEMLLFQLTMPVR